uniref:Lipase_GDSL domain-containing protein n=1 Tax=Parastrongyloides trichosuri TaxID=131310 RepID=A0A0N5A3Q5_PARTI
MKFSIISLLIFFTLPFFSYAITKAFRNFINDHYGEEIAKTLARQDLGRRGSFGGGLKRPKLKGKRPVILVHGITNSAGTFFSIRKHLLKHGYSDDMVYGTTYGDAGATNILMVTMECRFIMQVRMFIQAVADYTNSKVDVIAYSMGSPVARKAILGSKCVDTGRDLGPPITVLVEKFVSVAGANHGSALCIFPFGSCNLINGLNCNSRFITDINRHEHYEGKKVYSLYSTGDDKVGYMACGRVASKIKGEDESFQRTGMNHDQIIFNTADFQLKILKGQK